LIVLGQFGRHATPGQRHPSSTDYATDFQPPRRSSGGLPPACRRRRHGFLHPRRHSSAPYPIMLRGDRPARHAGRILDLDDRHSHDLNASIRHRVGRPAGAKAAKRRDVHQMSANLAYMARARISRCVPRGRRRDIATQFGQTEADKVLQDAEPRCGLCPGPPSSSGRLGYPREQRPVVLRGRSARGAWHQRPRLQPRTTS